MTAERIRPGRGIIALAIGLCSCGTADDASDSVSVEEPASASGIVTFTPDPTVIDGEDLQGRLPAAGDLSIYIAVTDLFPGTARIDPAIENPYAGDERAIAAGERHFAAFNCAGCHAPLGGGGMGPPLTDADWIYGSEPAQIYLSIMHGRPAGMPAWSSMLPQRTVWELVAYIETLDEIDDYAAEKGFMRRGPRSGSGETDDAAGMAAANGRGFR